MTEKSLKLTVFGPYKNMFLYVDDAIMMEDDTGACCLERTASQHLSELQWQMWSCASHVLYWFGTNGITPNSVKSL